ncbi:uncharacterized protein LOC133194333 [Saccostrea echinata]|uniref:uncharacterized protein LOC133194333 n=1 Tax=Saccostrea echinata TaxID=191078 RepID=UPI002A7F8A3C|nr:uncharacterized protein LOC133194333 [Saccostrea echinata]
MSPHNWPNQGYWLLARDVVFLDTSLPSVIQTSSITIRGFENIYLISCGTSDRLWVSDGSKYLLQLDSSGKVLGGLDAFSEFHTITDNGELLFTDNKDVKKLESNGIITTIFSTDWMIRCIHSSRLNGNILVGFSFIGFTGKVTRYDRTGEKILDIVTDIQGVKLYKCTRYITENKNGDIWTSDTDRVVVVDKSGKHRFNYRGQQSRVFEPGGICTDILGHVLVCDDSLINPGVHLLDQDGWFLSMLLTRQHNVHSPETVCVDEKHNLYLGQNGSNVIRVYKYLQVSEK